MSIVGSDFVTKSGFMFAGERLWNKVSGGGQPSAPFFRRFEKEIMFLSLILPRPEHTRGGGGNQQD